MSLRRNLDFPAALLSLNPLMQAPPLAPNIVRRPGLPELIVVRILLWIGGCWRLTLSRTVPDWRLLCSFAVTGARAGSGIRLGNSVVA